MRTDQFGRQILSENDLCHALLTNPDLVIKQCLTDKPIKFNPNLELNNVPIVNVVDNIGMNRENFDRIQQSQWFMPREYLDFDIAKYVLDLCIEDYELQRVGEELILYQERDMFPLLRYCKYLVDVMRENNIVWGVGRGSSVSSYVLYLIGIHRINSIHYDLSIDEFLK